MTAVDHAGPPGSDQHPFAPVFDNVVGQELAVGELALAVAASRGAEGVPAAAMTHAWLFTGPPGSGRSVAAAGTPSAPREAATARANSPTASS